MNMKGTEVANMVLTIFVLILAIFIILMCLIYVFKFDITKLVPP